MADKRKTDTNAAEELPTHTPGTRRGEDMKEHDGKEPGRHDGELTHNKRPSGHSTARDSTGINPQDPVDPKSPKLPPA
ncbi:MAG TPA: hypothetical protein VH815_07940 [Acidobacteriota bacterium]